jgi:hypothetical protein
MKDVETIAAELGVTLTPEIRRFAWFVNHYALIDFWESAAKHAKLQHDVMEKFMKSEGLK